MKNFLSKGRVVLVDGLNFSLTKEYMRGLKTRNYDACFFLNIFKMIVISSLVAFYARVYLEVILASISIYFQTGEFLFLRLAMGLLVFGIIFLGIGFKKWKMNLSLSLISTFLALVFYTLQLPEFPEFQFQILPSEIGEENKYEVKEIYRSSQSSILGGKIK